MLSLYLEAVPVSQPALGRRIAIAVVGRPLRQQDRLAPEEGECVEPVLQHHSSRNGRVGSWSVELVLLTM
jgi:hypothetical protein